MFGMNVQGMLLCYLSPKARDAIRIIREFHVDQAENEMTHKRTAGQDDDEVDLMAVYRVSVSVMQLVARRVMQSDVRLKRMLLQQQAWLVGAASHCARQIATSQISP